MQSTLRKPAVKNMRKALYLQYTVGVVFYYGVLVMGYWAYGSAVSAYLPENLSGPKWINVLINAIVFFQSIVSQHVRIYFTIAGFRWLIEFEYFKKTKTRDKSKDDMS